jgi:hypothetical protein
MQIKELSNVKEEVYGTLDSFVAWELEFPLIVVKKALKTLEDEREWKRIIQVINGNSKFTCQPFFVLFGPDCYSYLETNYVPVI